MTGSFLFATVFEFAAVVLIILGLLNEKKLIAFEDKLVSALGNFVGKQLRKHIIKRQAKQKKHLKAVPAAHYKEQKINTTTKYIA